ncbi:MAG: hypothetical protein ABI068_13960 [Ktedonobacterales bacterium]
MKDRKERRTSAIIFPLGPYHPALSQPVALTLRLRDDVISEVAPPQMGYCRRGIAALAEGQPIADALAIVERSCALAGATYRQALCLAIEDATQTEASQRGRLTRTLFNEVARLLARLWTLGQGAHAAELPALWHAALDQREHLFAALVRSTGERAYWAVAEPGGARLDLTLEPLREILERLAPAVNGWRVATAGGPLGRATAKIGATPLRQLQALGLPGIGADATPNGDLRRVKRLLDGYRDLPASAWPEEADAPAQGDSWDVGASLRFAAYDLMVSHALALACLARLDDVHGAIKTDVAPRNAEGRATVQGPHGPVTVEIALSARGRVELLRLTTPCAATVAALPQLLTGHTLAEAPLLLTALDLCLECADL